jgi:class 3 adenylate cyclase
VELGGETREVSVLFVDIVGSTELASTRPATEVVDVLNRFFGTVVEVVRDHGGSVNKFEGDAALAVFGAPVPLDDHASQALATARDLHERLVAVDEVEAAIGVSAGEVVAGNIGEERRFEYTAIGDPVNEAARLTELAKERGGVLASQAAWSARRAARPRTGASTARWPCVAAAGRPASLCQSDAPSTPYWRYAPVTRRARDGAAPVARPGRRCRRHRSG